MAPFFRRYDRDEACHAAGFEPRDRTRVELRLFRVDPESDQHGEAGRVEERDVPQIDRDLGGTVTAQRVQDGGLQRPGRRAVELADDGEFPQRGCRTASDASGEGGSGTALLEARPGTHRR